MNEFQSTFITLAEVTQYDGDASGGGFLYLYHPCQVRVVSESCILLAFKVPISHVELEWLVCRTSDLLNHAPFKCCALQLYTADQWWLSQRYRWDWLKTNLAEALSAQRRLAVWLSEVACDKAVPSPFMLASFKMPGDFV